MSGKNWRANWSTMLRARTFASTQSHARTAESAESTTVTRVALARADDETRAHLKLRSECKRGRNTTYKNVLESQAKTKSSEGGWDVLVPCNGCRHECRTWFQPAFPVRRVVESNLPIRVQLDRFASTKARLEKLMDNMLTLNAFPGNAAVTRCKVL